MPAGADHDTGIDASMLPDPPQNVDPDDVRSERRLKPIRLFVIRGGRLVELELRARTGNTLAQSRPAYVSPANLKRK